MDEGVSGVLSMRPAIHRKRGVPHQERRANLLFPWNYKKNSMETKNKVVRKPAVAQNQSNKVYKPIKLAWCTRTGRVVVYDDVRNPNG